MGAVQSSGKMQGAGKRKDDGVTGTGPSNGNETSLPSEQVTVNSLTDCPQQLYTQLSETKTWKENYKILSNLSGDAPKKEGHVRFVCISDTHNRHEKLKLPDGDILLHAGDFTWQGTEGEVENFCNFLKSIKDKYKHIVVIAGNHELTFDDMKGACFGLFRKKADVNRGSTLKDMLKMHCIYLEDEEIELLGFRIYGSPWWVNLIYTGTQLGGPVGLDPCPFQQKNESAHIAVPSLYQKGCFPYI